MTRKECQNLGFKLNYVIVGQSPEYEEIRTESELHVRIRNMSHLHTGLYSCLTGQVHIVSVAGPGQDFSLH